MVPATKNAAANNAVKGKHYQDLIALLLLSHLPVFVLDGIISYGVISLLSKMYPSALQSIGTSLNVDDNKRCVQ